MGPARALPTLVLALVVTGGPTAPVTESEPNDTPALANPIALGDTVHGTIADASDLDYFAFGATAGQVITVDLDSADAWAPTTAYLALTLGPQLVTQRQAILSGAALDLHFAAEAPVTDSFRIGLGADAAVGYRLRVTGHEVTEVEPNGSLATATPLAPGDTAVGQLTAADLDLLAIPASPGQLIEVTVTLGANADLRLRDPAGLLLDSTSAAFSTRRFRFHATGGGTYTLALASQSASVWVASARDVPGAPGDPTTAFTHPFGFVTRMIAARRGGYYLLTDAGHNLRSFTESGATALLVPPGTIQANDVTLDGFGSLLLLGRGFTAVTQEGLWRADLDGTLTLVRAMPGTGRLVTAPDASIWVAYGSGRLIHLDPDGMLLDSIPIPSGGVQALALAPDGALFLSRDRDIYRATGGGLQHVLTLPYLAWGMAFDRDGWLYVASPDAGSIGLYDPAFMPAAVPFATVQLMGALSVAFATTTDGTTSSGLYGITPRALVRLNASGVRAPGAQVAPTTFGLVGTATAGLVVGTPYLDSLRPDDGAPVTRWTVAQGALPPGLALDTATGVVAGTPRLEGSATWLVRADAGPRFGRRRFAVTVSVPTVTLDDVVRHLFGATNSLPEAHATYLDLAGNDNGRLDLGDLRAHLQRLGRVP